MGQPDIQQTFNAVSVEGFDQIYQPEVSQAQSAPDQAQTDPIMQAQDGPELEIQPDPSDGVSLEDAAKVLGLHMDTVRKRLQKGKIKGFKVADKFGEKWLVHKDELSKARTIQPHPTREAQAAPDVIQVDPIVDIDEAQPDPVVTIQSGPDQAPGTPTLSKADDAEHKRLMEIIESQAHQLKAAGDVIMYLRSEIEDKKEQVKLLTDSQHKPTAWKRLCNWFLGN